MSCPYEERVGDMGDGGKWLCRPPSDKSPCALLSVGSSNDFSYERAVGCQLTHVYDPTSRPPDFDDEPGCVWCFRRDAVRFFPLALRAHDAANATSLATAIERLRREAGPRVRILVKVDCEGCEHGALTTEAAGAALAVHVEQLQLEVHWRPITGHGLSNDLGAEGDLDDTARGTRMLSLWRNLSEQAGMLTFHKEPNIQYSDLDSLAVEYALINRASFAKTKVRSVATFAPHLPPSPGARLPVLAATDQTQESTQVPQTVWMTWRSISSIPAKVFDDLRRFAPEYRLRLLGDAECGVFVGRHCGSAARLRYDALQSAAHRADLWRYCAVWRFGGVYLDVKTWLVRPLREVFGGARNTAFTVLAAPPLDTMVYQGIIAAPPRDPTIRALLDVIVHDSLERLNQDYKLVMKQAYILLAAALGGAPTPGRAATTPAGRRWVIFRERERFPCDTPDKYGKCFQIEDDAAGGKVVFRTRHSDFPAGFLPRRNTSGGVANLAGDSFRCKADVHDTGACVAQEVCPARAADLADCRDRCLATTECVRFVHNVHGACYLKREVNARLERSSPGHATVHCMRRQGRRRRDAQRHDSEGPA